MARHLHPSIRDYVASRTLADTYDEYFARSALFRSDERFVADHLLPGRTFADALARAFGRGADGAGADGRPAPRALDLGFGTGRHGLPLARAGWAVTGVDLNPHMLAKARAKCRAAGVPVDVPAPPGGGPPPPPGGAAGGRIRLLEADWHALPLAAAERFDAVLLLFSALGLVRPASRRLTLLRQLRGRLADGGKLLLHAHNARWRPDGSPGADAPPPGRIGAGAQDAGDAADPLDGEDAAAGWEPGDRVMARYRGHDVDLFLHSFTLDELTDLLARAGYAVADLRPLSADRAGVYRGDDPGRGANGFLVCARAASGYA